MPTTPHLPVPSLTPQTPRCPLCDSHVTLIGSADGWRCDPCRTSWPSDHYKAEGRLDPDVDQCPAEVTPYPDSAIAHYRYRCVRPVGHPTDLMWCHVGARCDGGTDYDGEPYEWDDDDLPPPLPARDES